MLNLHSLPVEKAMQHIKQIAPLGETFKLFLITRGELTFVHRALRSFPPAFAQFAFVFPHLSCVLYEFVLTWPLLLLLLLLLLPFPPVLPPVAAAGPGELVSVRIERGNHVQVKRPTPDGV